MPHGACALYAFPVVYFPGPVPGSFSSLRELSVLCLDGNSLSGVLPTGLASLAKLRVLALQDNKLSGACETKRGKI